ncbi:MAG: methylated-DNA--[protein]-cysteine S-methyltransferase [Proteobacteria bacterium]|nr:methylated-DNA--[protein]-cysteine S-methyltransferase [Pseudomonadota bacterium]
MYARPWTRVKSAIPMRKTILATPIGNLVVEYEGDFVLAVRATDAGVLAARDAFAREAQKQLKAWFAGRLKKFDIPFLFPDATDFQVRVWDQITRIPFGATQTYGEIAREIKSGPRAVGGACRCNDLLLIVPCHRVVAVTGLGGFMGDRDGSLVRRKQWLLEHEQKFQNRC